MPLFVLKANVIKFSLFRLLVISFLMAGGLFLVPNVGHIRKEDAASDIFLSENSGFATDFVLDSDRADPFYGLMRFGFHVIF